MIGRLVLVLQCAVASAVLHAQLKVDSLYAYRTYRLPKGAWDCEQFEVLSKGVVVVPWKGGLFVPGANKWLLEPDTTFSIQGMTRTGQDGVLYLNSSGGDCNRVLRLDTRKDAEGLSSIARLPLGRYLLRSDVSGDTLVIVMFDGMTTIVADNIGKKMNMIGKIENTTIDCCTVVGSNTLLLSISGGIYLWKPGIGMKMLCRISAPVESLAMANDGEIYLSTTENVYAIDTQQRMRLIVRNGHGKLRTWGPMLYVLDDDRDQLIEVVKR